jgi:hypothetical protein
LEVLSSRTRTKESPGCSTRPRTCARLCHLAGGELDQIQFGVAVNDRLVTDGVLVHRGDLLVPDSSSATVVTLFLMPKPKLNHPLSPKLKSLNTGAASCRTSGTSDSTGGSDETRDVNSLVVRVRTIR